MPFTVFRDCPKIYTFLSLSRVTGKGFWKIDSRTRFQYWMVRVSVWFSNWPGQVIFRDVQFPASSNFR